MDAPDESDAPTGGPVGRPVGRPVRPGSPSGLRAANERRVLSQLRVGGPLAQAHIARRTGLSPAAVSNIVHALRRRGLVALEADGSGRRQTRVTLTQRTGLALGLDFGHRHLRVAIASFGREVLAEAGEPLDVDQSATQAIALAGRLVDRVLGAAGATRGDVRLVGMGLPGPVEARTGVVGSVAILPGWTGIAAGEAMSAALGMPVRVDNDANLGALAECTWGAGVGAADVIYLKVASGIGAGLVVDHRLYRGTTGTAGEVGHVTVQPGGQLCRCGNRGCLETLASGPVLLELLRRTHPGPLTVPAVLELARDGDTACRRVIADAGRALGVVVAMLVNTLNPQRVIIGGDLAVAGDLLLDPIRDTVARDAVPAAASVCQVLVGTLGDRAEVLGALALVLRDPEAVLPDCTV